EDGVAAAAVRADGECGARGVCDVGARGGTGDGAAAGARSAVLSALRRSAIGAGIGCALFTNGLIAVVVAALRSLRDRVLASAAHHSRTVRLRRLSRRFGRCALGCWRRLRITHERADCGGGPGASVVARLRQSAGSAL